MEIDHCKHGSNQVRSRRRMAATSFASTLLLASVAGVALASNASAADHPAQPSPASTNGNNGNHGEGNNGNGNPSPGAKADPKPSASNSSGSNGSINGVSGTGENGHYAVTICHATRSAKNPYVVITVDASSISHLMSAIGNGHGMHTGPVFNPAVNRSGDNWGDIIPPVKNPVTGAVAFPGLNTANLDWIARGCSTAAAAAGAANSSTSPSARASVAPTTSPSGTPSSIATPATGGSASAGSTQSGSGSASANGTQGASGNGSTNGTNPQAGAVAGSTAQGKALPGQAVLPAAVPAGDGSSMQEGIPIVAVGFIGLFTLMAVGAAVGAVRTREHDDSIN